MLERNAENVCVLNDLCDCRVRTEPSNQTTATVEMFFQLPDVRLWIRRVLAWLYPYSGLVRSETPIDGKQQRWVDVNWKTGAMICCLLCGCFLDHSRAASFASDSSLTEQLGHALPGHEKPKGFADGLGHLTACGEWARCHELLHQYTQLLGRVLDLPHTTLNRPDPSEDCCGR